MTIDIAVNVNLREKQEYTKVMSSEVGVLSMAEPTQESKASYLSGREAES